MINSQKAVKGQRKIKDRESKRADESKWQVCEQRPGKGPYFMAMEVWRPSGARAKGGGGGSESGRVGLSPVRSPGPWG